jgi:hypothetical protein
MMTMTDGRQLMTVPVPGRGTLHHPLPSHNAHSRRRSAAACPDVKGPVSRRFRNTAGKASTLSRQNRKPPTAATPQPIDVSRPRLVDDAPLPCYQSRLKQTSAQATSTNAKNRPESRSQRTCSRRQQLSHDSE